MSAFARPFVSARRADEFARLLDGAGAPVLVGRLRATGAALAPAVAPRPEFTAALRTRLLAVAAVQAAQAAAPAAPAPASLASAVSWATGRRGGRTAGVAAGALASVVAVSGVAVAGSQSLPGDPFYGVKRTTEALQLRAADGDLGRGTQHLDFAATRLREVRALSLGRDALQSGALPARAGDTPAGDAVAPGSALGPAVEARLRETLVEMDRQTRQGSALLTAAFRRSQQTAPLQRLARFATRQSAGLEQVLPALPEAAQDRARISLALLTGVTTETDELLALGVCGPACDPTTSAPLPGAVPAPDAPAPSGSAPCTCTPAPAPAPTATATADPAAPAPVDQPASEPDEPATEPTGEQPAPAGTPRPTPSPSPTGDTGGLPVPLPSLPVPLPDVPDLPLAPGSVAGVLPTAGPAQTLADAIVPDALSALSPTGALLRR